MSEARIDTKRGERGFSLAEVLVATALMAVILLALFGLVTASVRRAYGGKQMTQAITVAQSVMERANILQPQDLLGAASTASTATVTWTKTKNGTGTTLDSFVTAAAESGSTTAITTRNEWRRLLRDTNLPSTSTNPSTLTITMTALPSGRTFADCAMVRIDTTLSWFEWGNRSRSVRLQALNLRTNNP